MTYSSDDDRRRVVDMILDNADVLHLLHCRFQLAPRYLQIVYELFIVDTKYIHI